ncbi:MAG: hypothetical protein ACLPVI_07410 [Dehalococcoidales bacterium]
MESKISLTKEEFMKRFVKKADSIDFPKLDMHQTITFSGKTRDISINEDITDNFVEYISLCLAVAVNAVFTE